MRHDSRWKTILPEPSAPKGLIETLLEEVGPHQEPPEPKRRGRPTQILQAHLGWAMFWCFLQGWHAQLDLWRQMCTERLGGFAPVKVSDQAIYKRLATSGVQALRLVFEWISLCLAERLGPLEKWSLAPFASAVIAIDESKLDQVGRWLSGLRDLPTGDPRLLAGRLSCLFDVRLQQWIWVDVLPEAMTNSLVHARALLEKVPSKALLLFDLGYFSFEWLDELTRRGFFWVSRLRERGSYRIIHVFTQKDGYLDALIWLGAYRSDRAQFAVRLVQVDRGRRTHRYLTNVLHPDQLSGAEVVRLYQRRWDIELAFRALKDHLRLNVLWSAKWEVIQVQILASLILAQVFHAQQVEIAAQTHVEVFDVSLDLLIRLLPRKLLAGLSPSQFVAEHGKTVGLIRPHTRLVYDLPEIAYHEIVWPPSDIVLIREPRYAHKADGRKKPVSPN